MIKLSLKLISDLDLLLCSFRVNLAHSALELSDHFVKVHLVSLAEYFRDTHCYLACDLCTKLYFRILLVAQLIMIQLANLVQIKSVK